MILKNKAFQGYSKIICDHVDVDEGELIGERLIRALESDKNGIGLAAPQIGVTKSVCVINVKEPVVLINPKIVEKSHEVFTSIESCLSFPKKYVTIERYVYIIVEADNHESKLYFSADTDNSVNTLESACAQHEIDHLNGITMFDREIKKEPIKTEKQYGRNETIVIINKDKNCTQKLKWKKAKPLIDAGGWELFT